MSATHKIDLDAEKGQKARRAHKEEATFDDELQRYVMSSERFIMPKQKRSEVRENRS